MMLKNASSEYIYCFTVPLKETSTLCFRNIRLFC